MRRGRTLIGKVYGFMVRWGNKKIGKDTFIFNITPATFCRSLELGFCQLPNPNECFAKIAEQMFPQTLPFRARQTLLWDKLKPIQIFGDLMSLAFNRKISYLRFSESGDFRHQNDVDKTSLLGELLCNSLRMYGYTARRDLDFSGVDDNVVINGSGFMVHNAFIAVDKIPKNAKYVCCGDCSKCNYCKERGHKTIYEKIRKRGGRRKK